MDFSQPAPDFRCLRFRTLHSNVPSAISLTGAPSEGVGDLTNVVLYGAHRPVREHDLPVGAPGARTAPPAATFALIEVIEKSTSDRLRGATVPVWARLAAPVLYDRIGTTDTIVQLIAAACRETTITNRRSSGCAMARVRALRPEGFVGPWWVGVRRMKSARQTIPVTGSR